MLGKQDFNQPSLLEHYNKKTEAQMLHVYFLIKYAVN